jgi:hypothetical protein
MDAVWAVSTEKSAMPMDTAARYSDGKIQLKVVEEAGKKCPKRSW